MRYQVTGVQMFTVECVMVTTSLYVLWYISLLHMHVLSHMLFSHILSRMLFPHILSYMLFLHALSYIYIYIINYVCLVTWFAVLCSYLAIAFIVVFLELLLIAVHVCPQINVQLQIVIPTLENKEPEDLENHFPLAIVVTMVLGKWLDLQRANGCGFVIISWYLQMIHHYI